MKRTDYLAAALSRLLIDKGNMSAEEIAAELDEYYDGPIELDAIERELRGLMTTGCVESFVDGGVEFFMDEDSSS